MDEMMAADKVSYAITNLVLSEPFFGALALRMKVVADPSCKTMWVDGVRIGYNPKFIDKCSLAEVEGGICHEVLHVAYGHPWRRDGRDIEDFNRAADYVINPDVIASGLKLPAGVLIDPSFKGLSTEEVYDRIHRDKPKPPPSAGASQGAGSGDGQGDKEGDGEKGGQGGQDPDCGFGEVRDYPGDDPEEAEAESKVAVLQAATAARAMGNLPAGIERLVESIRKQKTDWVSVLWRFAQSVAKADFRWTRPNPRFLSSGLYLPGLRSEQMGAMVCVVDTSGSINDRILQTFGAEMTDIAEMVKPEKVFVVYCDAAVHRVDEYDVGEPITINPIGGGGTDFRPAFDWVAEQGIDTACLVFLTDMLGRYPEAPPEYPVLWATMNTTYQAPFGEIVPIEV